jgi:hypothetical protein
MKKRRRMGEDTIDETPIHDAVTSESAMDIEVVDGALVNGSKMDEGEMDDDTLDEQTLSTGPSDTASAEAYASDSATTGILDRGAKPPPLPPIPREPIDEEIVRDALGLPFKEAKELLEEKHGWEASRYTDTFPPLKPLLKGVVYVKTAKGLVIEALFVDEEESEHLIEA